MKEFQVNVLSLPIGRIYEIDGIQYPSVTTVLSHQESNYLDEWRSRIGNEEANKITQLACDRGNIIHELAEKYLLTGKDESKGYYHFLFQPIKKYLRDNVQEVILTECVLFSKKLETAGRTDVIVKIDNKYKVLDFKTSSRPKQNDWIKNYHMQSSFYCFAYTEMYRKLISEYEIIIVDETTFKVNVYKDKCENHIKDFLDVRKKFKKCYNL